MVWPARLVLGGGGGGGLMLIKITLFIYFQQRGDEVETKGPDVLTDCGEQGRVLQISTSYVAGIGGPCSPLSEWSQSSVYSNDELNLLRNLSSYVDYTSSLACRLTASCSSSFIFTVIFMFILFSH